MYTKVNVLSDRVPAVVVKKPELKNVEPFKTVLSRDLEAIAKLCFTGSRANSQGGLWHPARSGRGHRGRNEIRLRRGWQAVPDQGPHSG